MEHQHAANEHINLTDSHRWRLPPKRPAPPHANHADPTADDRTALTSTAAHQPSPTADDTTAPATCGQVDPDAQGRRDPAAADHANATTGGGADPTTDHHGGPGTHGTLDNRAVTTHDNRQRRHTTIDMTEAHRRKSPGVCAANRPT